MRPCLPLLIWLAALALAAAQEEGAYYEPGRFFRTQIEPILEKRCFECHSRQHEIEGGLALDLRADWEAGGDNGPAVRPYDLKGSLIIQAVRHHDDNTAMPPREKLPAIEIALLETWVLLGAPDPRVAAPRPAR